MIEIVFGESACGSLKIAQTYGRGKYRGSAISVFISFLLLDIGFSAFLISFKNFFIGISQILICHNHSIIPL